MAASFAVVGPGRLGQALARRWVLGGLRCHGFLGRTPEAAARALAFVGSGAVLPAPAALQHCAIVLVAVQDDRLAAVVADLVAAGAVRLCALWLHASGRFGLEPLQPAAAAGARVGALHPLCPVPDPAAGVALLGGKTALLEGGPRALRLLRVLAQRAGLVPWEAAVADRALYHAACALASNGVTALFDLCAQLLQQACGAPPPPAALAGLLRAALDLCAHRGAAAALSGPVRRGDHRVVAAHCAALQRATPPAAALAYRALMQHALHLAMQQGGLDSAQEDALRALLHGGAGC